MKSRTAVQEVMKRRTTVPGLMWRPTTMMGFRHGIKKLDRKAKVLEMTAQLLRRHDVRQALREGRVHPALKNPRFAQLYKEEYKDLLTQKGRYESKILTTIGVLTSAVSGEAAVSLPFFNKGIPQELGVGSALAGIAFGGVGYFVIPPAAAAAVRKAKYGFTREALAKARARAFKGLSERDILRAANFMDNKADEFRSAENELKNTLEIKGIDKENVRRTKYNIQRLEKQRKQYEKALKRSGLKEKRSLVLGKALK